MLAKFHVYWIGVVFSKKVLTRMRYVMKEKNHFVNKCDIEVNCVNCNGESDVKQPVYLKL